MRNAIYLASAASIGLLSSAPSYAASCNNGDISPIAIACVGTFAGNILNNQSGNVATQQSALATLGFTWDGTNFGGFHYLTGLSGATEIDFAPTLSGTTYIGVHIGGQGGGSTSFYKFTAGSALDTFTLNLPRSSGVVLYATQSVTPPVPEPASWAMMISGFGAIGGVLRARRGRRVAAPGRV